MTSGHKQETCISFPEPGVCVTLSEQDCFNGEITTGLHWATFLASQLYNSLIQFHDAFQQASFLASLEILNIATTFTPTISGNMLSFDSMVNAFTSALGIATSVLPGDGGVLSDFNTGITTIQSILALFPSSDYFTLPTGTDLQINLDTMLGSLGNATQNTTIKMAGAIFGDPNNATFTLPSHLIDGPFIHPVANYFYNVKPVLLIDSGNFTALTNKLTATMNKYLVGAALADGDCYLLKDASMGEDGCDGIAYYYVNGACYMLAYPGSNTCAAGYSLQATATNDTITSIESYGIKIPDIITNSEACQNTTNAYYGSTPSDLIVINNTATSSDNTLPTCFFNLPVFQLHPYTLQDRTYTPGSEWSPCFVSQGLNYSMERQTLGQTYLPANLEVVFDHEHCTCGYIPCQGPMNGTSNGTTNGINAVC